MAGTGKKWLVGCGVGCGVMILLSILLSVGGALFMTRPMNQAVDAQKELTAQFGEREEFIPPARLAKSRIKIFLKVRKQVMESCDDFQEITESFQAMEELDQAGEDPPVGDVLRGVKGVMGAAFGLANAMGEVTRIRNEALIEHGMGLGEYTWIYVMAYNSYLGKMPNTGLDSAEGHGYRGRNLRLVAQLMKNHATALEEAGEASIAELWREEAGSLSRQDEGIPFADAAVPADLAVAIAPYRVLLEKNYCAALADFDLNRIEKKGMSFHAD